MVDLRGMMSDIKVALVPFLVSSRLLQARINYVLSILDYQLSHIPQALHFHY